MRKSMLAGVGLLALSVLPAATAAAQTGAAWLHVRVEEAKDATKVSVNLPMTVVEAVLKASPEGGRCASGLGSQNGGTCS